jgi:hypothetical protein
MGIIGRMSDVNNNPVFRRLLGTDMRKRKCTKNHNYER